MFKIDESKNYKTLDIATCDIDILPPMPKPNKSEMRKQALIGWIAVLYTICMYVGITHGVAVKLLNLPFNPGLYALILIYSEAFVAICCVVGIMISNPGVIPRSKEACFPLPDKVAISLKTGESCEMENIVKENHSFCVRCYIWREIDRNPHHCRICNRCVVDFDHHCAVFGRCIAGNAWPIQHCVPGISHDVPGISHANSTRNRWCSGNMPYFITLFIIAYISFITTAGFTIAALYLRYS